MSTRKRTSSVPLANSTSNGVNSSIPQPSPTIGRSTSPAQATVTELAGQSWHRLMWIPLILLFPASIVSARYVAEMVAERTAYMAEHADKYKWTYPALSDLTTTWWSLLVLLFLRLTLCKFVFTPLGDWILPSVEEKKGKWTEAAREDRVQRFSVCMFKLLYFLCITIYGYQTLKDCSWLPPQLFGSGSVGTAWIDWPYSEVSDSVKNYYLIELSYHAHSLVLHLFTIHRNDFVEMTLHHTCAILLVLFSYFANFVRIGSLVLFLHDIADVMAYSVKAVVDTKYTVATLSAYAGLLISWGYTRLFVFPFYVIAASKIPGSSQSFVWYTSYAMVWLLQFLHIYWYILFLIMGYRFLVSGKTVDIQQKAGEQDGSYVDYHKRRDSGASGDSQQDHDHDHDDSVENHHAHASSPTLGDADDMEDELTPGMAKPEPRRTRSQKKSKRAD